MSEWGKCPACGKTIHEDELQYFEGWGYYCEYCCDKCSDCGKYFLPNSLTEWQGSLYCDDCLEKEAERVERERDEE